MDEKDQKILGILKEDSSLATREIAKQALLPITTVHNRIRRLKEDGIIKKYTVELDNEKLGKLLGAYVFLKVDTNLLREKKKTQHQIVQQLRKIQGVEQVHLITGGHDMIALVWVTNMKEYDHVLLGKIQQIEGITGTQTMVIIE